MDFLLFIFLMTNTFYSLASTSKDGSVGFEEWFKTQKTQCENEPIHFDRPLPSWLKGTLIRNGPAQYEMGKRRFVNALDGFAKLSSWTFPGNGSAYFSTKFILSEDYNASKKANDIAPYLTVASVDPPFTTIQRIESIFNQIDNMNINIYNMSGVFVALSDTWKLYEVTESLEVIRSVSAPIPQPAGHSCIGFENSMSSAHPLPSFDKDVYFSFYNAISLVPGIKDRYTVVKIRSPEKREVVAQWEVDQIAYMHSFSVTKNYVVLFAAPYYVDLPSLMRYASVAKGLKWYPQKNTDIYAVEISTGKVHHLVMPSNMVLHHINAYEQKNGKIVIDATTYRDPFFANAFDIASIMNATKRQSLGVHSRIKRYVIDIKKKIVNISVFEDNVASAPYASKLEVPTINENYRFKKYCFVYGIVFNADGKDFSHIPLVKKDVCSKGRDKMLYIPNHYPTEAWFVPSPPDMAKEEDDGVLLTSILDGVKKQSYLAIIDPKTMKITHKSILPAIVPFNFHGRFFPK